MSCVDKTTILLCLLKESLMVVALLDGAKGLDYHFFKLLYYKVNFLCLLPTL